MPVEDEAPAMGIAEVPVIRDEEYLLLLLLLLLLLQLLDDVEVATEDRGTAPVASNPLDLFRLARGHPDALIFKLLLMAQVAAIILHSPSVRQEFSGRVARPVTPRNWTPLKKQYTINLFSSSLVLSNYM